MATTKTDIFVYADWPEIIGPKLVGVLSVQPGKGRKFFSFKYDPNWIALEKTFLFDPEISWHLGSQFPLGKNIFGIFNDTMPDTWGRTLMKRREIQIAKEEKRPPDNLHEFDFLIGVNDECRMGGLRFKSEPNGPFINNDRIHPIR